MESLLNEFELDPYLGDMLQRLSALESRSCVAFATWIAERLFASRPDTSTGRDRTPLVHLRDVLDRLWLHASGQELSRNALQSLQELTDSAIGDDDAEVDDTDADADGEVVVPLIECLSCAIAACEQDSVRNAARAAMVATDVIAERLQVELIGTSYSLESDDIINLHKSIREHSIMRHEKRQQERIVEQLTVLQPLSREEVAKLRQINREQYLPPV